MKRLGKIQFAAIFALITVLFSAPSAQAEWITIEISGSVTDVVDMGLGNNFHFGDPVSGTYTFDSTTPYSYTPQGDGYWHYTAPAGVSLNINGFNFQTNPDSVYFLITVVNDNLGTDSYAIQSDVNLSFNGDPVSTIAWYLHDSTGTALSSDALPLITTSDLTKWDTNMLDIQVFKSLIRAEITSAEVVPEPASAVLLGLGAAFLASRRKRH